MIPSRRCPTAPPPTATRPQPDQLASFATDQQVALVCAAPVQRRGELLDLLPEPERVVPRLPEAEFCFTVKAIGLESACWLLELATPEQVVAAVDLDGWSGDSPEPARLDAWLDALATVGDDQALRCVASLDPELFVLYLKARIGVVARPDDSEGWEPPDSSHTLDGHFHFVALREGDDLAAIQRFLHLLFRRDYWTYFRMLQGVIWELDTENAEWALRWRQGRLQDLGFPTWEEAMDLYRYLAPEWLPSLPEGHDSQHLVFRTLARLDDAERRAAFYAFVGVANAVAVADQLELSSAETVPQAIEKAAVWISRGLEQVSRETGADPTDVVRRATLRHLFRVGANLDPEAARRAAGP
jgi:hypothetical protein